MKKGPRKYNEYYHCSATGDFMRDDVCAGSDPKLEISPSAGNPGRPRAIPVEIESVVVELHRLGYGYRAIARILRADYHLNPDFSTVKRTLSRLGIIPHPGSPPKPTSD
jgi:hypothetical protein